MSEWNDPPSSLVPSSIKGIHHIGVAVGNIEETISFYQSATSMASGHERISGGLPVEPHAVATLAAPNGYLQLMQFPDERALVNTISEGLPVEGLPVEGLPVEGPGITHICYQSPAPDALFHKFIELDATAVSTGEPPIDLGGYGVHYGYARDADMIMFEVEQLDEPRFEGPIWIAHVALVSPDLDRLVNFYQNLLGVAPYNRTENLRGKRADQVTGIKDVNIRAAWFNTGNMIIEIWQYTNPVTPVPQIGKDFAQGFTQKGYNKFALEVGDLAAECARLTNAGVKLSEPMTNNGVIEVYLRDPDGNLMSLLSVAGTDRVTVDDLQKIEWLPSPASPNI